MLQVLKIEIYDDIIEELLSLETIVILIRHRNISCHIRWILAKLGHWSWLIWSRSWSPLILDHHLTHHLLLDLLDVFGGAPHQDFIGILAFKLLKIGGEMLLEDDFTLLIQLLRKNRDPLLCFIW